MMPEAIQRTIEDTEERLQRELARELLDRIKARNQRRFATCLLDDSD